jgi:DNA helicase-2/ATP-dependent DNA helicase PcrA
VARTVDPSRLRDVGRGRIEAAAGCGKTEAIIQLTAAWTGRRTLILTHTLAGVAALRRRLQLARVPADRYSLSSIDAWCVRRVSEFPRRAGPLPDASNPRVFYPAVRAACARLLASHAVDDVLRDSYGRVFVDEYQDCGPDQHSVVSLLAELVPTFVLGDPQQAVFNFPNAPVVSWDNAVAPHFALIETLDHPWRWERAGAPALGQWLTVARAQLQAGVGIDLAQLPAGCEWRRPSGDAARDAQAARTAASYWQREAGSVLILASPTEPHRHADLARGGDGIQVVENLDLRPIAQKAAQMDGATADDRLRPLLELAHAVMTGIAVEPLLVRCNTLRGGRARVAASPDEAAAVAFAEQPHWAGAITALRTWSTQPGRRIFRREVLAMLLDSFASAASGHQPTLGDALAAARERRRHQGRSVTTRAVGSTLLLKGLEADFTVLLDVERLSAAHVYVALTRATRGMLVFSAERWIGRPR